MDRSAIEWTDSTFNPWIGCTKVGPGCDHCYAEALMDTRYRKAEWGAGKPRVHTSRTNWKMPERWNRVPFFACDGCGWRGEDVTCPNGCTINPLPARRRVFCASLADVFDNEVPTHWRVDLWALIDATPNLDWLILTKRVGLVAPWVQLHGWPANAWLGATVVNQDEADRDVPKLLATRGPRVRFLSCEPLLDALDLNPPICQECLGRDVVRGADGTPWCADCDDSEMCFGMWLDPLNGGISWVIAGGESGSGARPMHPDWARSLRDQCAAEGVPFLFKQWGEWWPAGGRIVDGADMVIMAGASFYRIGKKAAGRELDRREHSEFPTP